MEETLREIMAGRKFRDQRLQKVYWAFGHDIKFTGFEKAKGPIRSIRKL